MIRVVLPQHLRTLAGVDREVQVEVMGPVTQRTILDALELRYPMLRGAIRDHETRQRRPLVRFFACQEDLSHESPDAPLPAAVASGAEPFFIIGAIAGGSTAWDSANENGSAMTPSKSKPKAKRTSQGGKPRKSAPKPKSEPASRLIDQRIRDLGGWRGQTLARMRVLILEADPEMTEEWKWRTPVWSHNGIVCTGEAYTKVVKLTFARGASIPDPSRLFNSSLEGNTRRAIDIHEGEQVDAGAFKTLIKAAVAQNASPAKTPSQHAKEPAFSGVPEGPRSRAKAPSKPVKLLSGGNPQIAKADGDAPVQAYIAAMPGWKRDLGERLDALVARNVPDVRKAVKWNSPFYGIEGRGWFLSFHVFTRYVKVTFFRGTSLRPPPPGGTGKDARWIDIHEKDSLDEMQIATWIKQAAALPGWVP